LGEFKDAVAQSEITKSASSARFPLDSADTKGICSGMAELDEKWPENVKGKFYVDEQCIDCDLCRETAPDNFTRNEDGGYSFVYKQPTTQEEIDLCMEALEGCPVEAIGDNGEEAE
jgi:ferredoxin